MEYGGLPEIRRCPNNFFGGVPPNHPLYTFESGFFYPNHLWKPPIFRIGIFPAEKNWEPHGIG